MEQMQGIYVWPTRTCRAAEFKCFAMVYSGLARGDSETESAHIEDTSIINEIVHVGELHCSKLRRSILT